MGQLSLEPVTAGRPPGPSGRTVTDRTLTAWLDGRRGPTARNLERVDTAYRTRTIRHWDRIVAAWAVEDDQRLDETRADQIVDLGSQWGGYEYVTNVGFADRRRQSVRNRRSPRRQHIMGADVRWGNER